MASNALYETVGRVKNSLSDMRKKPQNALLDTVRGGLLGATTDTIGYIPDAVADFMRPFGYNVPSKDVVGGTEWLANRVSKPTNSLAETAARFTTGMLTPSPADFARLGNVPKSDMTVYHGSPHDFDKFDSSKIGTGEGAQAYGHGLYVAESPGVAKSYQTALSSGDIKFTKGTLLETVDELEKRLRSRMDFYNSDAFANGPYDPKAQASAMTVMHNERRLKEIREMAADPAYGPAEAEMFLKQEMAKNNFAFQTDDLFKVEAGRLYTVDLPDSHIDNMLDWDAPLSEQPVNLRKALERAVDEVGGDGYFKQWEAAGGSDWPELKVNMLDEALGDAEVSKLLAKHGVSGIKYFDGGSRTAKTGTRNYVVFDDKLLKILNKE